jgi:Ser/Thr protein kinase RdoA (MazF antagonist)
MSFENLTPDAILSLVESACGLRLTGFTASLPSYINRVYELRAADGAKLIVKFYRPGRWSRAAIEDEHRFVLDCSEAEVPVVPARMLENGSTIGEAGGLLFAVYPRKAGRQFEINHDADWTRLGALIARMHLAGEKRPAQNRLTIHPKRSTLSDVEQLCGSVIPEKFRDRYRGAAMRIIEMSEPSFDGVERIRIHGDCHRGNILDRLDEGLLLIDFDDMAMGPPVQDLWLLLPDRRHRSSREIGLFIEGYERFRAFDRRSLACIEPLRAMRMIYFLAWCARQREDLPFRKNFPDWGSEKFWERELNDLREQLGFVTEALE